MVNVFIPFEANEHLSEAFERLIPQLSASLSIPSPDALHAIVTSPTTRLFCAEEDGVILGVLSLAWYDVPSGRNGWIEDVVVDAAARGRGVARTMVVEALAYASRIGIDKVSLTSHASRRAAHALYLSAGFEHYDTALFRIKTMRNLS